MNLKRTIYFFVLISLMPALVFSQSAPKDSLKKSTFPFFNKWTDSYLNRFNIKLNPLLSLYPDSAKTKVAYNPKGDIFSSTEKIANSNIDLKKPQSLSFEQFNKIQNQAVKKGLMRDIEKAQDGNSVFGDKRLNPLLEKNKIFDRLFGDKIPEFNPNGFISVDLRAGSQFINNPLTPLALRRQTVFDWDQQVSVNFNNLFSGSGADGEASSDQAPASTEPETKSSQLSDLTNSMKKAGKVKEKLNIEGNLDTKAAFDLENKVKLNFKNDPEDLLQKVELGNVSMPNRSQLIPGVQNLLGAKLGFKFGRLDVSVVAAQQNSRTESILINGGNQSRGFEIRADNYEENKHFFLGQFFRDNYEKSLKNLPVLTAGVRIIRAEVYVTNRSSSVTSMRNLVGVTDIGEKNPLRKDLVIPNQTLLAADNTSNNLYDKLARDGAFRVIDNTSNTLKGIGLTNGDDFEILRGAKRLSEREFEIQPELGYISLLTPLRNDEILAVAYEYTYLGRPYKVGELTEDYVDKKEDEVIILKLLKSSTLRNRLNNPMWNLMMKNVYSLAQGQIKKEGFQLRIVYKDDQTGLDSPNLKEGINLKDKPIIEALGLDRLNFNNDPLKDGNFDYVEGVTVNEKYGRIIFPVLEPFGSHFAKKFEASEEALRDNYVFNELYTKTLVDAQQISLKNKFFLSGSVQTGSSEISLPLGASGSSVKIFAGGTELKQGVDYTIDTQIGRVLITNQSVLSSGRQIRIEYEKPDLFQTQIRRLFGMRLDYTVGPYLRIGATMMSLRENTPGQITRTTLGSEPVNNMQWGIDVNLKKDFAGLTRALDALPGIQTKEPSTVILNAEFAQLRPGVNNKKVNGSSMIDDFEFARNVNDLSRQVNRWRLGSTPQSLLDSIKTLNTNPYQYNYRRAKLSVYSVDPSVYIGSGFGGNNLVPEEVQRDAANNIYEKSYQINDIFPGRSQQFIGQLQLPSTIMDIAYFPSEPGMYNYNADLTSNGLLKDPKKNFGSTTRGLTFDADFDNANVEYQEFWLLDPFAGPVRDGRENKRNTEGGKLLIHLGDVSEDVIPDSRFNFENGIKSGAAEFTKPVRTPWGLAPRTQYMTDAFDNQESTRKKQDVGLDGISDEDENNFPHIKDFINKITGIVDAGTLAKIKQDPSKDNFKFFLNQDYDGSPFLKRFESYLGMENNAPPVNDTQNINTQASTNLADKEDINNDNTINDIENYYEYEVDLRPNRLDVGKGYIVDKVNSGGTNWYLFRIPIRKATRSYPVGKEGFKSIRFMRIVTTEWKEPVVLRFGAMQLVSNQYRVYENSLTDRSQNEVKEKDNTVEFNVNSVNVEENGCPLLVGDTCSIKKGVTPYVVPPGFIRDRDRNTQLVILNNEQSLSLNVKNLRGGQARAIYKNTKLDLNMYKRIKMFVHTENPKNEDGAASTFIRLGTDLKNNYYEIEIPSLKTTIPGSRDPLAVWPKENELDISLDLLRSIKLERNRNNVPFTEVYGGKKLIDVLGTVSDFPGVQIQDITRKYYLRVKGNPDLSNVLNVMIGLKNNDTITGPKEFTAWFDELRAFGFDQENGEAGILSADIKLADVATLSVNGGFRNYGYGGVQDRISARSRELSSNIGISSTIEIDKFFPLKWGLSVPLFVNYEKQLIRPTFNPLDPDIRLEDALLNKNIYQKNLSKELVEERSETRGFNFTNVRKIRTKQGAKQHFYDIENFTFSYAQFNIVRSSFILDRYAQYQNRAGFSYQYTPKQRNWEPFKKFKKMDKPVLRNVKELNFAFIPTSVGFRSDYDRSFILNQFRDANLETGKVTPNIIKYFLGNRYYDAQWELTKSASLNYTAQMTAIQDDVDSITTQEVSFWNGIKTLGRAKNYNQKMQLIYRIPLDKFFLLDWMKVDSRFNNSYGFTAGSFQIKDENGSAFGNMLENGREIGFTGQVDLVKLYNKLKFLRLANTPDPPKQRFTRHPSDDEELKQPSPAVVKSLTRLLMTIRGINFNLVLGESTLLPGFLPTPKFFGLDNNNDLAPGFDFVMGAQKRNIHKIAADKKWLSESIIQNNPFTQTRNLKFDFSTNLEPFKGFRIQIKGNLTRGDSYQELYRPELPGGGFNTLSPVRNGNFSMSFWSFKTGFARMSGDSASLYQYKIFDNMVSNRQKVLERLNTLNVGENGLVIGKYDLNSQDVLIPAFFSAYSGQDLDKIFAKSKKRGSNTFNPFLAFPMPNWRIDYQGLEKFRLFKKYFSSITLSHEYRSTYSVGNFTSSLEYGSQVLNLLIRDYPLGNKTNRALIDGQTPPFIPTFIMSTISMEERFSPLIGMQFTTKRSFTGSFNWNKDRRAALNLSNAQVAEYNANDLVFGIGFKKNNVKMPFRGRDGNKIVLKNDMNFRLDVTSRDLKVLQRRLDGVPEPVDGNYNLQIKPQIQYQINSKINIGLYYDRQVSTPFTSRSYERSSSIFGINARFNLGD